jgi:hypothetical protein
VGKMTIYFIQNFIRDLIIIFVDQSGKVKKISLKSVISLDEVIDKVNETVEDETLITEVKLKGRSSILRAIELYYNKLEGVNVKWL